MRHRVTKKSYTAKYLAHCTIFVFLEHAGVCEMYSWHIDNRHGIAIWCDVTELRIDRHFHFVGTWWTVFFTDIPILTNYLWKNIPKMGENQYRTVPCSAFISEYCSYHHSGLSLHWIHQCMYICTLTCLYVVNFSYL